jgi:hypothetical protein
MTPERILDYGARKRAWADGDSPHARAAHGIHPLVGSHALRRAALRETVRLRVKSRRLLGSTPALNVRGDSVRLELGGESLDRGVDELSRLVEVSRLGRPEGRSQNGGSGLLLRSLCQNVERL